VTVRVENLPDDTGTGGGPEEIAVRFPDSIRIEGLDTASTELEQAIKQKTGEELRKQFGTNGRGVKPDAF
jgi:hypothetical protein